jgi:chromosomal replication initiator protein
VNRNDAQSVWGILSQDLSQRLPERAFADWVSPCVPMSCDGETLWLQTPSMSIKIWIEQQLLEEFYTALTYIGLPDMRLVFDAVDAKPAAETKRVARPTERGAPPSSVDPPAATPLPPTFKNFTLDSFVVGSATKLAFSAASGIVENYGHRSNSKRNPLFIYGATGLGKTHLMVAIGNGLMERNPNIRLAYTKSDRFFHEVSQSIHSFKNTEQVRQKYQAVDLLVIDDIQMLRRLERSQEEIFYIFEHLHQHEKQVVITSDTPPDRLEGLYDRLIARCKGGLIADLQPPDLETRFAILKKKLEDPVYNGYPHVPEEVLFFIASKAKASVRDLEGLLSRTMFQASFLDSPVTIEIALEALKGFTGEEPTENVSIERICKVTAEHFGISFNDLIKKKSRKKEVLVPRQVAMYLARELASTSYKEIGRAFNNMHHSTVMNAIASINARMQKDPDFNRTVKGLLNGIA